MLPFECLESLVVVQVPVYTIELWVCSYLAENEVPVPINLTLFIVPVSNSPMSDVSVREPGCGEIEISPGIEVLI